MDNNISYSRPYVRNPETRPAFDRDKPMILEFWTLKTLKTLETLDFLYGVGNIQDCQMGLSLSLRILNNFSNIVLYGVPEDYFKGFLGIYNL